MLDLDVPRLAARRRPFDLLERRLVRLALQADESPETQRLVEQLRYAISFAKLTAVRNPDGTEIDLLGLHSLHAQRVRDRLAPFLIDKRDDFRGALQVAPEILAWTLESRASLLSRLPLDRDALEAEVTTRMLLVASGGGGGAGYVYPGAYDMLDRIGLTPSLMVGTSIGSLMGMFRARHRRFDLASLVSAARALSWGRIFRVLEVENRYGLPATLRLYLREALGHLFQTDDGDDGDDGDNSDGEDGVRPLRISDLEIPYYSVVTGITVDALKHDLNHYEHLLDADVRSSTVMRARSGLKAMGILQEFLSSPEALREIVIGRAPGTQDFDVLDAAGFSAAIPGVIHYDVLRADPRMHRILDHLYATYGITRLGEGGMVSNVPARIAWETATAGLLEGGRRNSFTIALDCFAPSLGRPAWLPFQEAVRRANVTSDRAFADFYLPFPRTLSPLNLVPAVEDAMQAIRWGREAITLYLPWIRRMMDPIPVLQDLREG